MPGPRTTAEKGRADLHVHTWYSDGRHPPNKVVETAAAAGITLLAITDHESVDGIEEARRAGLTAGVEIVPGIEFSTRLKSVEAHILGLWIDVNGHELREAIKNVYEERRDRAGKMVEKLNGLGINISMEDVEGVAHRGGIGRPHLAQALVNIGAVPEFEDAFKLYIGNRSPAYAPRRHFTPREAIDAIHLAGGLAVLAHGLVGGPQREHVREIAKIGLDAVEVVHPKLNKNHSAWLRGFAAGHGLGTSGGSDWHGEGWSDGRIGEYTILKRDVFDLLKRRNKL
jgi:predicted metal-dependent phosphoesterase TrpH